MARRPWNGFKQRIEWCSETGKPCYDKITARTAVNARFAEDHVRLRIYACPTCQREQKPCWHLTHLRAEKEHDM